MQRFFLHFATVLRRNRGLTLLLFVGLSLASGFFALHSRVDNSLAVWQSADDPHWVQYQDFVAHYQIIDPLIVYLPGIDLLSLEDTVDAIKEQTRANSLQSLAIHALSDEEAGLLFVIPKAASSPTDLAALLTEVEGVLQRQGTPYHLGGVWYLTTLLDQLSAKSSQM